MFDIICNVNQCTHGLKSNIIELSSSMVKIPLFQFINYLISTTKPTLVKPVLVIKSKMSLRPYKTCGSMSLNQCLISFTERLVRTRANLTVLRTVWNDITRGHKWYKLTCQQGTYVSGGLDGCSNLDIWSRPNISVFPGYHGHFCFSLVSVETEIFICCISKWKAIFSKEKYSDNNFYKVSKCLA